MPFPPSDTAFAAAAAAAASAAAKESSSAADPPPTKGAVVAVISIELLLKTENEEPLLGRPPSFAAARQRGLSLLLPPPLSLCGSLYALPSGEEVVVAAAEGRRPSGGRRRLRIGCLEGETYHTVRGGDGKKEANFLDGKSEIVCLPILADGRGTILNEKYRIRRWSWNTYYSPWGAENYFIKEARAEAFFLIKYGRCH